MPEPKKTLEEIIKTVEKLQSDIVKLPDLEVYHVEEKEKQPEVSKTEQPKR